MRQYENSSWIQMKTFQTQDVLSILCKQIYLNYEESFDLVLSEGNKLRQQHQITHGFVEENSSRANNFVIRIYLLNEYDFSKFWPNLTHVFVWQICPWKNLIHVWTKKKKPYVYQPCNWSPVVWKFIFLAAFLGFRLDTRKGEEHPSIVRLFKYCSVGGWESMEGCWDACSGDTRPG